MKATVTKNEAVYSHSKKKELNEAIELQEFERAAQLRDEIKETEKEKDKE